MRRAAPLLAALLVLGAGTACGERAEPTGSAVRIYPVRVQGASERETVLTKAPHRIVPLGPGPRRILRALGLQRRTITVNEELVGLSLVAQIRKARPDLIVASGDADPLDLARARSATHAAVYVQPDNSLEDVERSIDDVGLLTGRPVAARKLSAAIARTRNRVAARLSGYPVVSTFVDLGELTTVGSHTLLGDLVSAAHGKDVAGPSPEQGPFPLRRLARLDPRVYVATSDSGTTLKKLRSDPHTKRLAAVRGGRFGIIRVSLLKPGPQIGAALEQVARILHPDAFR
jgi:iron complex transport system substrate-binding protein